MASASPASPAASGPAPALRPLVAACFSAAVHGGRVIRDVVARGGDLQMVNKAEGSYDPQTVADRRSQQRLVFALREAFPGIAIVGEEGELAPPSPEDVVHCDLQALDQLEFVGGEETQDRRFDWEHLVLWVDPLDGTKRFAAKKFDEVSVLIGVTYKQRPIAGVVHLPFHGEHGITYWGGPGIGVFRSVHEASETQTTHAKVDKPSPVFPARPLTITVSSTNCDLVNAALRELAPGTVLTGGATGTMVLGVITGASDAFLRFKAATRKWDICAVEPLLEALGGTLTDPHGRVYTYDPVAGAPDYDNERGLVACLEPETLQTVLRAMGQVQLTRALDGREMTSQWFQEFVFPHEHVSAVRVVADSMHWGKHSAVAKLDVVLEASTGEPKRVERLFLKKSVRRELPPRSATHWRRDLASYRTEATFYANYAPTLQTRGVALVQPLAVFQSDATDRCSPNLVASNATEASEHLQSPENFMLLLECFGSSSPSATPSTPTYEAADCLKLQDTQQALRYLAELHASVWGRQELLARAKTELWSAGCWWAFPKRGEQELAQAAEIWPQVLESFRELLGASDLPPCSELESLGQRMVQQAAYISESLSVDSEHPARTLLHGDFKSANLFFETQTREVVAFDWQWSGLGLGAMDVANLLNTSVSLELLDEQAERRLLRFYYDRLARQLRTLAVEEDLASSYPFEALERHYQLATLEYARLLISNFWRRMTPESCAAKASNANCGLGYRSVPHVLRLVKRLHEGLARVEAERGAEGR